MIRFALALLGLSAGAADAQRLVPLASVVENCGLHVEVQTDETDSAPACVAPIAHPAETEVAAGDEGSAPQVPPVAVGDVIVPARAVVSRPVLPVEPAGAKPPTDFGQTTASHDPTCVVSLARNGMHPLERDVVFAVAMDGSDPSAMFCP